MTLDLGPGRSTNPTVVLQIAHPARTQRETFRIAPHSKWL